MEKTNFKGVEDTLFIPLAAKVLGSKCFPHYFYDEKSLEFQDTPQVKAINEQNSEYTVVAFVARYYNIDKMVSDFTSKNPDAIIINLGAGIETKNMV